MPATKIAAKVIQCSLTSNGDIEMVFNVMNDEQEFKIRKDDCNLETIMGVMKFFNVKYFNHIEGRYCYVYFGTEYVYITKLEQFPNDGFKTIEYSMGKVIIKDNPKKELSEIAYVDWRDLKLEDENNDENARGQKI